MRGREENNQARRTDIKQTNMPAIGIQKKRRENEAEKNL